MTSPAAHSNPTRNPRIETRKTNPMKLPLLLLLLTALPALSADDAALVKTRGSLLFEDDFARDESAPDKEQVGNGWTTNSAARAKGTKQVDLDHGAMHITKAAVADHGVSVVHAAAFQDGAVQCRFKLGPGDDLGLDFADMELKTVHAGHLFAARLTLKGVTLMDHKTGGMDNTIRERRLAGDKSPELAALLKTKTKTFPVELKADDWHQLLIVVEGDTMRATVDGKAVGEFKSEGFAHPTKRTLRLAVNQSAWVDDMKVWKLK